MNGTPDSHKVETRAKQSTCIWVEHVTTIAPALTRNDMTITLVMLGVKSLRLPIMAIILPAVIQ